MYKHNHFYLEDEFLDYSDYLWGSLKQKDLSLDTDAIFCDIVFDR